MSGNRWRQVLAVREAVRSNLDGFSLFPLQPTTPHTLHRPATVERHETYPTPDKGKFNTDDLNAKKIGRDDQSRPGRRDIRLVGRK
jgi:hypothetical protein